MVLSGTRDLFSCCQGQRPSISTTNDQLKKVRIRTNNPSMAMLSKVALIATVETTSAATSFQTLHPCYHQGRYRHLGWPVIVAGCFIKRFPPHRGQRITRQISDDEVDLSVDKDRDPDQELLFNS